MDILIDIVMGIAIASLGVVMVGLLLLVIKLLFESFKNFDDL